MRFLKRLLGLMLALMKSMREPRSLPVGMWGVNGSSISSVIEVLPRVHPECSMIHSDGGAVSWGFTDSTRDPLMEGRAYAQLVRNVAAWNRENNASFRVLVFRNLWGLVRVRGWSLRDVRVMISEFQNALDQDSSSAICGFNLGNDFDKHEHSSEWGILARMVGWSFRDPRMVLTQDLYKPWDGERGFYASGARPGERLPGLRKWLLDLGGVIPVVVPQYYPWAAGTAVQLERWWKLLLDELQSARDSYCPRLVVEPIVQASAYRQRGVTAEDLSRQLRAVGRHPVVSGAWLLVWNPRGSSADYRWALDSNWEEGLRLRNGVQIIMERTSR